MTDASLPPAIAQSHAFARRHIRVSLRDRAALFWSVLWPTCWYLLTMYLLVLPQLPADTAPDTLAVIKTTQAVTFGIFGALTVCLVGFAGELTRDLEEKRYRGLRSYPIVPEADLFGRFIGSVLLGVGAFGSVLAVGVLDGAYIAPQHSWLVTTSIVLTMLVMLCGLCTAIALLVVRLTNGRSQTNLVTLTIVMIAFFVTGFNGTQPWLIPGEAIQGLLNIIPNTLTTRVILDALVVAEWSHAGLTPPAMPTLSTTVTLVGGYISLSAAIAVVFARRWLYAGDAGE